MTVGDGFRNMSDEELADEVCSLIKGVLLSKINPYEFDVAGFKQELIKLFGSELEDDTN